MRRGVCLVLDGFGVGDLDGPEATANTADSVQRAAGGLEVPTLDALGLAAARAMWSEDPADGGSRPSPSRGGAGRARPAYAGADTYLGHQELMGTIPDAPERLVLDELGEPFVEALRRRGLSPRWTAAADGRVLMVGPVAIHDNIEAARGLNINVTGSIDEVPFEEIVSISEAVRAVTKVGRVIAVGGRGYTSADILAHVRRHEQGHIGVDTPSLGVYDDDYRVRHLGYPVDTSRQLPSLARAAGLPVALLGKAADVVSCPGPEMLDTVIDTDGVFDRAVEALETFPAGLVVMNVQETDLAGHEQDPVRYRKVLERVDHRLADLLSRLTPDDLLVISADHGNDPTIGSSQHTREFVPLLVSGADRRDVGTRDTMADVGATLCDWLGLPQPQDGTPITTLRGRA